jgi:oxalate decarboxylase
MSDTDRRAFLGGLAFAAGSLTATSSFAANNDGHAAGYDVAPAAEFQPVIPRRTGDPIKFTVSLDQAAIKATSGGWARDITARTLPIATDAALAHLFLNPGGVREMHWHNSAEWAYILSGACQVTVVDPEGETEVANYAPETSGTSRRVIATRSRRSDPSRATRSSHSMTDSMASMERSG